jgi:hypothetical protein
MQLSTKDFRRGLVEKKILLPITLIKVEIRFYFIEEVAFHFEKCAATVSGLRSRYQDKKPFLIFLAQNNVVPLLNL